MLLKCVYITINVCLYLNGASARMGPTFNGVTPPILSLGPQPLRFRCVDTVVKSYIRCVGPLS